jgi:hypothetical protein
MIYGAIFWAGSQDTPRRIGAAGPAAQYSCDTLELPGRNGLFWKDLGVDALY